MTTRFFGRRFVLLSVCSGLVIALAFCLAFGVNGIKAQVQTNGAPAYTSGSEEPVAQDASVGAGGGDPEAAVGGEIANVGPESFRSYDRVGPESFRSYDKALTGLSVSPEGVYFDGPKGGPFRQSEGSFRIRNTSLATINWSVDEDGASPWAIISSTASGALAAGESIEVVVQLDTGATAAFAGGSYTADLIVHNNDTGEIAPMPVNLFVADPIVSSTHPNPNLRFANTSFAVSWSGTFYPESNRFLWKIDDQPDSVIVDTDPDIHTASGVRQVEVTDNEDGTHYFHLAAIDPATTGVIDESLRHYQFNVIGEPPTITSSSHPNDLSMQRDFIADVKWSTGEPGEWQRATSAAGWPARCEFGAAVFNNRLWVMGGDTSAGALNDVWSSVDGKIWVLETGSATWPARGGHGVAVLNNRLWVIGGHTSGGDSNDVWSSADGKTWVQETGGAPWERRDFHGVAAFDNRLWVLGGDPPMGT